MAPYVPSDHPQQVGMRNGGVTRQAHEEAFRKYGPPPPNYNVVRSEFRLTARGQKHFGLRYLEASHDYPGSKVRGSLDAPLSPQGLTANSNPIIGDEPDLNRENWFGVIQAPITYKAGTKATWRYFNTWQGALSAALASHGFKCKSDNESIVTEKDVNATFSKVSAQQVAVPADSVLYHPADRKSLIFKNESDVAITSRAYNASLIVICPFVDADAIGFNRIYDIKNRPPVYARWSTGQQAHRPPVVLGCIPRQNLTQPSSNRPYDVMWFFIDPTPNDRPAWAIGLYTK
ncbi:hypothetical protein J4E80_011013 [Alternaria sp. BMP 0032]|nr:hypothetical protein J4E80_011013 [Alternaria sp. BMP 0032]